MEERSKTIPVVDGEDEIRKLIEAERARLRLEAGLRRPKHFAKPVERAFTREERQKVTILIGGLTWKHEKLIVAVFEGAGYKCEMLPVPRVTAFQIGKEFGNNGQCNPTYFTVGNLVEYLQYLESQGLSRQEIVDNYVFFTAGSCGPCRFGMYEAEYRFALENAGFNGFRVMLFQQNDGVKAASGQAGLEFTVDFGLGALNAVNMGDVINDLIYQIRPFEVNKGETDKVFTEATDELCSVMRDGVPFEILERAPQWSKSYLLQRPKLKNTLNTLGKIREHLWGKQYIGAMEQWSDRVNQIEVDRLRVKPVVKITGEFWAQITEGDGNFNMFAFLEREGAQVMVEPIATWVAYLLHQAKSLHAGHWDTNKPHRDPKWNEFGKRWENGSKFYKKQSGFVVGEVMWNYIYHRTIRRMGDITHHLIPQKELAALAHPFYHQFARGGEGHLEVGKNVYYTVNHLCHMVLALKPFGCMPSTQSDGVQSAVVNKFKDMLFIPIETSGEGEVNAHSRVQMALGEAKVKAKAEFEQVLKSTGKSLDDIREYVERNPELKRPFYKVPHTPGVAGTAAHFVLHINDRMEKRSKVWRRSRSYAPALPKAV